MGHRQVLDPHAVPSRGSMASTSTRPVDRDADLAAEEEQQSAADGIELDASSATPVDFVARKTIARGKAFVRLEGGHEGRRTASTTSPAMCCAAALVFAVAFTVTVAIINVIIPATQPPPQPPLLPPPPLPPSLLPALVPVPDDKWPSVRTGWAERPNRNHLPHSRPKWLCDAGDMRDVCKRCDLLLNTRKYDSKCNQGHTGQLIPLLVTGCGGTGTHTITSLFGARGVSAAHERFREDQSEGAPVADAVVGWPQAVNDWYLDQVYPWAWKLQSIVPPENHLFKYVAHVVRCPLDNIAAMTSHSGETHTFLHRAGVPLPKGHRMGEPCPSSLDDKIAWAAFWWIEWNAHIERYADYRFKTETLYTPEGNRHLSAILRNAGIRFHASGVLNHDDNHRSHIHDVTLRRVANAVNYSTYAPQLGNRGGAQVVARLIRMARHYGYGSECLV